MRINQGIQISACSAVLFLATVLPAGAAGDSASFVSETIATNTVMAPGRTFTQTWTVQNTGTNTWSAGASGYILILAGTDSLGAVPLSTNSISTRFHPYATIGSGSTVAPGASATFSMSLIAPEAVGTYADGFQMANASGVSFGPTVGVQIIVQQAGPSGQYDRATAVSYANNYAGFVCSDGYFWTNGSDYGDFGASAPVPAVEGDDCAHFVSSCIGSEPNQQGGGLTIPSRVPPTYGEPGAGRLAITCLIGQGLAAEVFSLGSLAPGDVIVWNFEGVTNFDIADIDHATFYLGNGLLAAHSNSRLDVSATTWYQNEYLTNCEWHLIHIFDAGDTTPPTVSIGSPTNGQPFTVSTIAVSGTANDPGSPSTGVILVQAQVNGTGGTWQPASGTTNWSVSVSLSLGTNTVYVRSLDGAGNYSTVASVNVTCLASTITLSPTTLPGAVAGAAYSQSLTAAGGTSPYTFAVTAGSLPAGLSLSTSGSLSGAPSAAGTNTFTVTATDSKGYAGSQGYTLVVASSQAYASGVANNSGQIQYRLNAPAGDVQVAFDNGSAVTNFGSLGAGLQFFSLGSHTNYSIIVSSQGSGSPVQISVDSTLNDFYGPRGVAVNLNAKGTNFGRVYVANAAAGTDSRRTTQRGVYALNADLSDAFGYGATAYPTVGTATNQIQYGSSTTYGPYHLFVGPDDMVYLADASGATGVGTTVGGGVWMLSPNLTKTVDLFTYNGTANSPGLVCVVGTPNVFGSVASTNLVLYTVEWNRQPYNNIWQYGMGNGPFPWTNTPVQLASAGIPSVNEVLADLCIAPDGKFFASEDRLSATGGNVSLWIYAKDGLTYLWDSSTAAGGTDPFVNSYCMAVSPDDQYVATGTASGSLDLFHLTNGIPDLSTFTTIAAGFGGACRAVAWDLADNVYGVSGSDDLLRVFSLGLGTIAITTNDITGTNGSFQLLTASSPPSILAQPQNQQSVVGSNAAFTAAALSVPALGYQWKFDGTNLSGASTSALVIANVLVANAGSYQVVVTNANGAVTSAGATLTVNKANAVVTAWPTATAITYGQTLGASALNGGTATPAGSFDWTTPSTAPGAGTAPQSVTYTPTDKVDYNSLTNSLNLVVLPAALSVTASNASRAWGQANPVFTGTITGIQNGDNITASYICAATTTSPPGPYPIVPSLNDPNHRLPDYSVTTNNGTLTVTCPAITLSPTTLPAALAGAAYSQSLTATGGASPYRFAVPAGSLPAGLNLSGSGSLSGTPSGAATNTFTVTATDTNGCAGSQACTLVVDAAPAITAQPASQTNNVGSAVVFNMTATGTQPLCYQWRFNGTNLAGAMTNCCTLASAQATNAGSYCVVVTNAYGAVTSSVAVLTVFVPTATLTINLAVSNIVHQFSPPQTSPFPQPGYVSDQLIYDTSGLTNVNLSQYKTFALRLFAPNGQQLVVAAPTNYSSGLCLSYSAGGDSSSHTETATLSFENLAGGLPTRAYSLFYVGNAGNVLMFWAQENYTNAVQFTAMQYAFTPVYNPANTPENFTSQSLCSPPVSFGYTTSQTNDPGPLVTLAAFAQPAMALNFAANTPTLSWISRLNTSYQPQWSTNLSLGAAGWNNLGPQISGNGFSTNVSDSPAGQPQKFYRLMIYPPGSE
jgi:hypothetical protein